MLSQEVLIAIGAALLTGAGGAKLIESVFRRREIAVKGELQIVDASIGLITEYRNALEELKSEVTRLNDRVGKLEKENYELRRRCSHLEEENKTLRAQLEKQD